jgi:hypothetical protein
VQKLNEQVHLLRERADELLIELCQEAGDIVQKRNPSKANM